MVALGPTRTAPRATASRARRPVAVRPVVQAVGRRTADVPRHRGESAAVFLGFAALYAVVGHWLVLEMHVVGFETLDRFGRGLMVFHNDSASLAAIGLDYPPLAVLLVAPLTLVPSLTSSLAVVPIGSAVFAALTLVFLNTMMRRARVAFGLRLAVLAALGLNPLVVMYASVGARNFLWLAFVVAAIGALFAWYVTADIRHVLVAGIAFAAATLAGYGSLLWFLVGLVAVVAILSRLGAAGTEVEGTAVGLASPTVYVVTLWSVFNLALVGRPFDWITASSDTASSDAGFSLTDVVRATGELVLHGAPIALVVLPALVVVGVAQPNGLARWLAVLLLASILAPGLATLTGLTDSPMVMSNALPVLLVSVVGALWLARSTLTGTPVVAGALVVGLLLSIPWTFAAMETFPHQGIERAFHDAVATGGSQEGATTVDGSVVGYDDERAMAEWIGDNVDRPGSILTDNAQTYAVILLSGRPSLFFDRVDRSDGPWRSAAADPADPAAGVDYLLLSTDPSRDLLSERYPDAAAGTDPDLRPVLTTDRYRLVAVPVDDPDSDPLSEDIPDADEPAADETDETDGVGGVGGVVGETPPEAPSP